MSARPSHSGEPPHPCPSTCTSYPRGYRLGAVLPFEFKDNKDTFGESVNSDGSHNFALYMQNGRIKDYETLNKAGLVDGLFSVPHGSEPLQVKSFVAEVCDFAMANGSHPTDRSAGRSPMHWVLTNNQNLIISHVPAQHVGEVKSILDKYKIRCEPTEVRYPTTCTIFQQDGPNHLGLC